MSKTTIAVKHSALDSCVSPETAVNRMSQHHLPLHFLFVHLEEVVLMCPLICLLAPEHERKKDNS